jgi:hypothetical protein
MGCSEGGGCCIRTSASAKYVQIQAMDLGGASQQRLGPCRAHLVVAQVDLSGVRAWEAKK